MDPSFLLEQFQALQQNVQRGTTVSYKAYQLYNTDWERVGCQVGTSPTTWGVLLLVTSLLVVWLHFWRTCLDRNVRWLFSALLSLLGCFQLLAFWSMCLCAALLGITWIHSQTGCAQTLLDGTCGAI